MTIPGNDSSAFDLACAALETLTTMNRSETRGTLRMTLRDAGLDSKCVGASEICAVAASELPHALRVRGVRDALEVCRKLQQQLVAGSQEASAGGVKPEG